ncbi:MAG: flagellar basal body L-ring protein FlgH [Polaromonas sp.]|jgi:flagellar L-ring protein precursor FlgH
MRRTFLLPCMALLSLLASGCETLRQSPKVDLAEPASYPLRVASVQDVAASRPTGGLFKATTYRPAFEDRRARMPGDIVTIQISESITARQSSSSSIDRSGTLDAGVSALPFMDKSLTDKFGAGGKSSSVFAGKGGTESAQNFIGTITATVMEILPNGHLALYGEKQVGLNENVDVLRFSGTVAPHTILPGNVVSSTQVANVRIASRNRGAQGESQAMGWLSRAFLSVLPF